MICNSSVKSSQRLRNVIFHKLQIFETSLFCREKKRSLSSVLNNEILIWMDFGVDLADQYMRLINTIARCKLCSGAYGRVVGVNVLPTRRPATPRISMKKERWRSAVFSYYRVLLVPAACRQRNTACQSRIYRDSLHSSVPFKRTSSSSLSLVLYLIRLAGEIWLRSELGFFGRLGLH